ncbi:hypothetical protein D3P09_26850 [Paenibacillus pinisoli]|uniref:Uncharacterized protein n=1 Tax=Paenibacillus pinisoli TaxID=1276110 RepID=A0A3A6PK43_9BACL|nr:hypothetical protein [Paenibacillus pinisoli]RJX36681.1 hypothetical protein D3P09_26850 [Paenibacillus pinisoli]
MKTISLKLLVLIMLIVLAVISIWLERKDDERAVSEMLGEPAATLANPAGTEELWQEALAAGFADLDHL